MVGICAAAGYAAELSHCRFLCRSTFVVLQACDAADMLTRSLERQCRARAARAALRQDAELPFGSEGTSEVSGTTQLIRAAARGDDARLRTLIALGAPLDAADTGWQRMTALQWASANGRCAAVGALLDAGAQVDARTESLGWSALSLACYHGCEGVTRELLARGADARLCDSAGESALMKACYRGHASVVLVLLLRDSDGGGGGGYDSSGGGGEDGGRGERGGGTRTDLDAQDANGMTALNARECSWPRGHRPVVSRQWR